MHRKHGWSIAILLILLSLFVVIDPDGSDTARAGSADDPEIVDPCPEVMPDEQMPFADICAGWFETNWTPLYDDQGQVVDWSFAGIRATLELAGNVADRQPKTWAYELAWRVGDCRNLWYFRDNIGLEGTEVVLGERCSDLERYYLVAPSQVLVSGHRIEVTLSKTDLSQLSTRYEEQTELVAPTAYVQLSLEVDSLAQVAQDWEEAGPGRSYSIGQDKPEIP